MKMILFSVKDVVSNTWTNPMAFVNVAAAQRWFRQSVKSVPTPQDFELFVVGCFNSDVGTVDGTMPDFVERGLSEEAK